MYWVLLLLLFSCIEPYEFKISDTSPSLVVEGYISDASYDETILYPSNGKFFNVKLSYTSDVSNIKNEMVTGASVSLISKRGGEWKYTEIDPGVYGLINECFKAEDGQWYKIRVSLPSGAMVESDWSSLPDEGIDEMGNLSFEEVTEDVYKVVDGKRQIVNVDGIDINIYLSDNMNKPDPIYYQWTFEPSWIFQASLPPLINKECWISNSSYLSGNVLHKDVVGGYGHKLFFMETLDNERLLWQFSLLVRQFQLDKNYYEYLSEVKDQTDESLVDRPPYNVRTNLIDTAEQIKVVGYFAVVREKAIRWYINQRDLSYGIENKRKEFCLDPLNALERGPECQDCLAYGEGTSSLKIPIWWKK